MTFSGDETLKRHCAPILVATLAEDPSKLPMESLHFFEIDSLVPSIIADENPLAAVHYSNYIYHAYEEDRDRVMDADLFQNFFDMTGHQEVVQCVLRIVNQVCMQDEIFLEYLLSCGVTDFLLNCLFRRKTAFHMSLACLHEDIVECLREVASQSPDFRMEIENLTTLPQHLRDRLLSENSHSSEDSDDEDSDESEDDRRRR
jgi:hypothetical protein